MGKASNSFSNGMNLNLSDMVIPSSQARMMMNMRVVDLDSSTFAISNIRGTEEKFQLTNGYIPLADAQYNGVLYILSINPTTSTVELGSFPSPDYSAGLNTQVYRPFNNLDAGPFRTTLFGYSAESRIKLVLQPDYDESINVILIGKGFPPRIINSKFKGNENTMEVTTARPGNANSNTYTTASLDKETRLQIFSDQVLKIAFGGMQTGGKVKPGNYSYVFYYMTEDFSRSEVIGQSSICQVAFGTTDTSKRGGISSEETNLKVTLNLSNIDTDFKYIKVYALYSSGLDGVEQQYLEFVTPISITGSAMVFSHTGFETLQEVSQDVVNATFYGIDSANTGEQINGYLILGGIQESTISLQELADASADLDSNFAVKTLPPSTLPGYADPANVYDYMGSFGNESYPYGIVYVLPGGALSPVFPVRGRKHTAISIDGPIAKSDQANGVITFPNSNRYAPYKDNLVQVKHLEFDMTAIPTEVREKSIGFFFVRGERRPWMITQGLIIPTVGVPPIQTYKGSGGDPFYYDEFLAGEEDAYKLIPCVDQLIEAFRVDETGTSSDSKYVVDDFFQIDDGYMPITITDRKVTFGASYADIFPIDKWAFISGDALYNEPKYITSLQREAPYIVQLSKGQFRVKGAITPLIDQRPFDDIPDIGSPAYVVPDVGLHYDLESVTQYDNGLFKQCEYLTYVSPETFAASRDFISRVGVRLKFNLGSSDRSYDIYAKYNSFFGFKTASGQALVDSTKGAGNPQAGDARMNNGGVYDLSGLNPHTSGVKYSNLNLLVPAGWIANVYPSNVQPSATDLYPTTDNIVYKQVSQRYTWDEATAMSNTIPVFGGDAYICRVSRKLNQSGFRNPFAVTEDSANRKANIDQGIMITWWQESEYNLHLRNPVQFDAVETEKRSFFPFQSGGDFEAYRKYRYPETVKGSPGYSELMPPKTSVAPPSLSPAIRNNFFSRLSASARHVPNAFRNGYRIFLSNSFRDYDAGMGEIVGMFNHGNKLIVVFEHGVGAAEIEQRVLTGSDSAGPVYAEPSSVLPPQMQFLSRTIGAQDPGGLIQTSGAIYGMDQDKKKIWQLTDVFKVQSDEDVSSFLEQNSMANPRCGHDFRYNEIFFTTDYYTLIFKEGLGEDGRGKFTSFYRNLPRYYASRGNDFYTFRVPAEETQGTFHRHDANTRLIYGEEQDAYVEFVINESVGQTKIFDVLTLISNEVRPSKIEWFTYDIESERRINLDPGACNQFTDIVDGLNIFTQDNNIPFVNKEFVISIPKTKYYNGQLDQWGIGGRMSNKLLIVRVTYNTDKPLKLLAAITDYKFSPS